MNQIFYEIDPDEIDIEKRKIQLKELDHDILMPSDDVNGFRINGKYFKRLEFKRGKLDDTFPNTCIYIVDTKSYTYQTNIVSFDYFNQTTLIATKMTGSTSIPAGEEHLRLNMVTHELAVQHAWLGFKNPYWNNERYVLKSITHDEISIHQKSNPSKPDIYMHISQFHPVIAGK